MEYVLTPYSKKREPFAWWENAFSEEELNWLQKKARESVQQAQVGGGSEGALDTSIRRSEINWLSCTNENRWVFSRLAHIVSSLNAQFFFFDLTGFGEQLQLTNYNSEDNGMYGWHVDFGSDAGSPSRKLSLVLQLSDPVDYEGGVLEIQPFGKDVLKMRKQRGLIICFPSWTLHQVTPVTLGSRQSLVSWITGPTFV